MDLLQMRHFVTSCISPLETIGWVSYATLWKMLMHFVTQDQKVIFINITIFLIRNVLNIGKHWQIQVFQNSDFHLKAWFLSLAKVALSCGRLTSFLFEKNPCHHLSVVHGVPWRKLLVHLIIQRIIEVLFSPICQRVTDGHPI